MGLFGMQLQAAVSIFVVNMKRITKLLVKKHHLNTKWILPQNFKRGCEKSTPCKAQRFVFQSGTRAIHRYLQSLLTNSINNR